MDEEACSKEGNGLFNWSDVFTNAQRRRGHCAVSMNVVYIVVQKKSKFTNKNQSKRFTYRQQIVLQGQSDENLPEYHQQKQRALQDRF